MIDKALTVRPSPHHCKGWFSSYRHQVALCPAWHALARTWDVYSQHIKIMFTTGIELVQFVTVVTYTNHWTISPTIYTCKYAINKAIPV